MPTQHSVCRRNFLKQSSAVGTAAIIGTLSGQLFAQEGSRLNKMDLARVTSADFTAVVGTSFQVEQEPELVLLELAKVNSLNSHGRMRRQPFSVVFRSSRDVLKQDVFSIRHLQLGQMRLLLVPVVSPLGDKNYYYESVFA